MSAPVATEEMVDAAVEWFAEKNDGAMPLGQLCREIYLVMETERRKRIAMDLAAKAPPWHEMTKQ